MREHETNAQVMRELSPLTDSLTSCIRWRLSDYEAMLRGEVELLLGTAPGDAASPRAGAEHHRGL